jgi:hypothetical protein
MVYGITWHWKIIMKGKYTYICNDQNNIYEGTGLDIHLNSLHKITEVSVTMINSQVKIQNSHFPKEFSIIIIETAC